MAHNQGYYQQQQQQPQQQQFSPVFQQPQNIYQQLGKPQPQAHLRSHPTYTLQHQQQQQQPVQSQGFHFTHQHPQYESANGQTVPQPAQTPYQMSQTPYGSAAQQQQASYHPSQPQTQLQPYNPSPSPFVQQPQYQITQPQYAHASQPQHQPQAHHTAQQQQLVPYNPMQQQQSQQQQQHPQMQVQVYSPPQPPSHSQSIIPTSSFHNGAGSSSPTTSVTPSAVGASSWRVAVTTAKPPPISPSALLAQQASRLQQAKAIAAPPQARNQLQPQSAHVQMQLQTQKQQQQQPQFVQQTTQPTPSRRPLPQPAPGVNATTPALPPLNAPKRIPVLSNSNPSSIGTSTGTSKPFPQARPIQITALPPSSKTPSPTRSSRPLPTPADGGNSAPNKRATMDLGRLPHPAVSSSFSINSSGTGSTFSGSSSPTKSSMFPSVADRKSALGVGGASNTGLSMTSNYAVNSPPEQSDGGVKRRASPPKFQSQPGSQAGSPVKENAPPTAWNRTDSNAINSTNINTSTSAHSSSHNSALPMVQPTGTGDHGSAFSSTSASKAKSASISGSNNNTSTITQSNQQPPQKFTPIWKRTIPEVPAPVWGYAAGMVSEPHPKPKLQAPPPPPPGVVQPVTSSVSPNSSQNSSTSATSKWGKLLKKKKSSSTVQQQPVVTTVPLTAPVQTGPPPTLAQQYQQYQQARAAAAKTGYVPQSHQQQQQQKSYGYSQQAPQSAGVNVNHPGTARHLNQHYPAAHAQPESTEEEETEDDEGEGEGETEETDEEETGDDGEDEEEEEEEEERGPVIVTRYHGREHTQQQGLRQQNASSGSAKTARSPSRPRVYEYEEDPETIEQLTPKKRAIRPKSAIPSSSYTMEQSMSSPVKVKRKGKEVMRQAPSTIKSASRPRAQGSFPVFEFEFEDRDLARGVVSKGKKKALAHQRSKSAFEDRELIKYARRREREGPKPGSAFVGSSHQRRRAVYEDDDDDEMEDARLAYHHDDEDDEIDDESELEREWRRRANAHTKGNAPVSAREIGEYILDPGARRDLRELRGSPRATKRREPSPEYGILDMKSRRSKSAIGDRRLLYTDNSQDEEEEEEEDRYDNRQRRAMTPSRKPQPQPRSRSTFRNRDDQRDKEGDREWEIQLQLERERRFRDASQRTSSAASAGLPQPPLMMRQAVTSVGGSGADQERKARGGPRLKSAPIKFDDYDEDEHRKRVERNRQNLLTNKLSGMGINDNGNADDGSRIGSGRSIRSDSRASSNSNDSAWPADLPRLPRTPGSVSNDSQGYFDIQPRQQQTPPQMTAPAPSHNYNDNSYNPINNQVNRDIRIRHHKTNLSLDDPPPQAAIVRTPSPGPGPSKIALRRELPQPQGLPQSGANALPANKTIEQLARRRSLYSAQSQHHQENSAGIQTRPQSQVYSHSNVNSPVQFHTPQQQQMPTPPNFSATDKLNQQFHNTRNQPQTPAPPPIVGIESPHPVGGRAKMADIPKMEEDSNYGSDTEHGQVPRIQVGSSSAPPRIHIDGSSSRPPSLPTININHIDNTRNNIPMISIDMDSPRQHQHQQVNEDPKVQIYDIPGISVSGPVFDEIPSAPSINVSGPDGFNRNGHQQQRPQSQARSDLSERRSRPDGGGLTCGGCYGSISGRIVSAMGMRWHPGCFKCTVCNELLEHVSSYEHEGRPYCHLDYHENFAPRCYSCKTAIIEEQFISLDDPALGKRAYHTQHFFCSECGDPFLNPSSSSFSNGELALSGDGEFEGFTVYKGYPYCEACHVRLRLPKCKRCKKSIRDHDKAVEALGGKWCWGCFVCASCQKPFEDPSFFQRGDQPYCEHCFSIILRNEI